MVQMLYVSPLEVEVDVLYAQICRTIEAHRIERVVLDGVTAIGNALHDERRFREFMHGLMAFTKQRSLTTFICYEHPEIFGLSQFMPDSAISSIVDNIILLTFVELGDRMRRAILVAKARGCDHSLAPASTALAKVASPSCRRRKSVAGPSFRNYVGLLSRAPARVDRRSRET